MDAKDWIILRLMVLITRDKSSTSKLRFSLDYSKTALWLEKNVDIWKMPGVVEELDASLIRESAEAQKRLDALIVERINALEDERVEAQLRDLKASAYRHAPKFLEFTS
jgi:hypothetical protein